jgi:DHA3 family macrolide efflux protein-like MFS transporter
MEAPLRANQNFRLYFSARIVSQLGDQLYVFAVSWFVLDLTKSSFHMAALLAINALAAMAAAPIGGLIADRVSRKAILVVTDVIQGAVLLALLALQQTHLLSLGMLYAGTVLLGLCSAVFSPAAGAIIPGIVGREHVPSAVAAGQAASNVCTILGMLLGGAMYGLVGIAGVLAFNAASNLVAAGMESRIQVSRFATTAGAAAEPAGVFKELRDGLRHVRADRAVFVLLLVNTTFTLAALPIPMVSMPYLFNVVLAASPAQAAFPQAAVWVGIILGSTATARLLRRRRPETLIAGGLLALAIHSVLMVVLVGGRTALGPQGMSIACTVANLVAGTAAAFFVVPTYSVFHARTAEQFRGRFWGLEAALRTAAMCAGYFLAGALAQRLPLELVYAEAGVVLAVLSVIVMRLKASQAAAYGKTAGAEAPPR